MYLDEMQKVLETDIKKENNEKMLSNFEMSIRWKQLRREMTNDVMASTKIYDNVHNLDYIISFQSVYTNVTHRLRAAIRRGKEISLSLLAS